jgi:hypothetical protein
MNDSQSSILFTFVTQNEDGSNKINLYGNPAGLRALADALIEQADVDQSTMRLPDGDTDHTHYKVTHDGAILSKSSDEIQMGRVDTPSGELAYWAKERLE